MPIQEFLKKYSVKYLYHFTDTRNLASIRQSGGLLSWAELKHRKINVLAAGGNDWSHDEDSRRGLDAYVHLCFCNVHPMEYRARTDKRLLQTRFLQINPAILSEKGVLLSAGVANKSGVKPIELADGFEKMDWEAIYGKVNWKDKSDMARVLEARKYEVLVPGFVPIAMISGL